MSTRIVGIRVPVGQLALIEKEAGESGQTASQWMRDAALSRLNSVAENERLLAMEERMNARFDGARKALIALAEKITAGMA